MSQGMPPGDDPDTIAAEGRGADDAPPPRRLTKRKEGEVIDGVCSGIGAYLGVDPVLVRLGFVAAVFAGGAGILAYIVCMVIVPEDPADGRSAHPRRWGSDRSPQFWVGVGLILLAAAILAGRFDLFDGGVIFPLVLIGVGVALWRTSGREPAPPPPDGAPDDGAPAPTAAASTAATPTAGEPTIPTTAHVTPPYTPVGPPDPHPHVQRPRSVVGRLTVALALVVTGVLLALERSGVIAVSAPELLASALVVVGGGLLVATWWGRARGLLPLGIVLVLAVAASGFADRLEVPLAAGVGERIERPGSVAELGETFELSLGHLVVDLTGLEDAALASVRARIGVGQLEVLVPSDVDVVVDATAGAGQLELFGTDYSGGLSIDRRIEAAGDGAGTIELDLSAGVGQVVVDREGDITASLTPTLEGSR